MYKIYCRLAPILISSIIFLIYALPFHPIKTSEIFYAHDSFIFLKDHSRYLLDLDNNLISSLSYFSSTFDFYLAYFLEKVMPNQNLGYLGRIAPLFFLSLYFSCVCFRHVNQSGSPIVAINTSILLILAFMTMPFQWLINTGPMLSLQFQITYVLVGIIAISFLNVSKEKLNFKQDVNYIIFLLILLEVFSLWTFSLVITTFIFSLIIFCKLNFLKKNVILNNKYFFIITIILFLILIFGFYYALIMNGFNYLGSLYEGNLTRHLNASGGAITGGLLNQMQGFTDWTMYTRWIRYFGTMDFYSNYFIPQIIYFIFYLSIILFILEKPSQSNFLIIFSILLLFLFISKGAQPPFGNIFTHLVGSYSIFGAIRTPDNKFGAYSSLIIITLLIYISANTRIRGLNLIVFCSTLIYLLVAFQPLNNVLDTKFGKDPNGSSSYPYIQDFSIDDNLPVKLFAGESPPNILLVPGYGNFLAENRPYGPRDPIAIRHTNTLNFTASLNNPNYGYLLSDFIQPESLNLWMHTSNTKFILFRSNHEKSTNVDDFFNVVNESKYFENIYSDNNKKLFEFKPNLRPVARLEIDTSQIKYVHLGSILITTLIIIFSLIWFKKSI